MGDPTSFWLCTAIWALCSALVWKLVWFRGLGDWLCAQGQALNRVHDPDLSFRQPIRLRRAVLVAAIMTLLLYGLLCLCVGGWAQRSLSRFRIYPDVVKDLGLQMEDGLRKKHRDLLQPGNDTIRKGMVVRFVRGMTGTTDGQAASDAARDTAWKYLELEDEKTIAIDALTKLLLDFANNPRPQAPPTTTGSSASSTGSSETPPAPAQSSAPADSANSQEPSEAGELPSEGALKEYLSESLMPWNLESLSAEQLIARLSQRGANFVELHNHLEEKFKVKGAQLVAYAVINRLRARVAEFRRVKDLFIGSIQGWTIFAYFLALILLSGRARLLEWQARYEVRFEDFRTKETDRKVQERLAPQDGAPSENLFPRVPVSGLADYQRERGLVQAYMRYLNNHAPAQVDWFALAALDRVYAAMIESVERSNARVGKPAAASLTDTPEQAARSVLQELTERAEARLERVEYSAINYLLWALPSLGFIGTIVGIGESLGRADQVVRASDSVARADAITRVTSLLGFAFDTTLVALMCGLPVMALLYAYRSRESQLILDVQQQISSHVLEGSDPQDGYPAIQRL